MSQRVLSTDTARVALQQGQQTVAGDVEPTAQRSKVGRRLHVCQALG
jgi:hypothetical protein